MLNVKGMEELNKLKYYFKYAKLMKYPMVFIVSIIGMLGIILVSVWMLPFEPAVAQCEWEPIPGSNEITCVPSPGAWIRLNPQPLPPMGNWVMLNPQPLPPIFLDKSLFSNTTQIKISPLKDGSIIISAINSTNGSKLNANYSMNQP